MQKAVINNFANFVYDLRVNHYKASQHKFACMLDVAQATISLWEKGKVRSHPEIDSLQKLARLSGLSLGELQEKLGLNNSDPTPVEELTAEIVQLNSEDFVKLADKLLERLPPDKLSKLAIAAIEKMSEGCHPSNMIVKSSGTIKKTRVKRSMSNGNESLVDIVRQRIAQIGREAFLARCQLTEAELNNFLEHHIITPAIAFELSEALDRDLNEVAELAQQLQSCDDHHVLNGGEA